MNIAKITIGRLYNLGNYEHIRYELTVELKEGDKARDALIGMENILSGLKPLDRCGIASEQDIQREEKRIEEMRKLPVAEWDRQYGHCKGTPSEVIARFEEGLKQMKDKRAEALNRAALSRQFLDNLGGAAFWKDAKDNWETD